MSKSDKKNITDKVEIGREELKALQESEQRYRNILENSSFGISAYDESGQCILANRALAEIIAAPDVDHILRQNFKKISSWKKSGLLDAAREALETDEITDSTVYVSTTFGKDLWLDCKFIPYKEKGESFLMFLAEDITMRRLAEIALEKSNDKYSSIVEKGNDGIVIVQDGLVVFANSIFHKMVGLQNAADTYRSIVDFVADEHKTLVLERYRKRIVGEDVPSQYEVDLLKKNGGKISVELNISSIEFSGKPAFMAFIRDMTERKIAEQIQRKSEERLQLAIEGSSDGLWDLDLIQNTSWVSSRFEEMLGYRKGEFERAFEKWQESLHPVDKEDVLKQFNTHLEDRSPYDVEYRLKTNAGVYKWFRARGQAVWDDNGTPLRVSGSIQDISDLKQVEGELKRAHSELERRVEKRTGELAEANKDLLDHIEERKRIEMEVMEKNTALKVLLEQRVKDQSVMEQNILHNIKSLVRPYITKLKNNKLAPEELANVHLIEANLEEIVSPFARKLTSRQLTFSTRELEIADLVRSGKQGKEIAELLNLSLETVNTHRKAIRRKLGLTGKGSNLRSTLIALSEK